MVMMKIEALCCIGKHNESYALTTTMMRTNSRYPGLLFWRAKCLYYMNQVSSWHELVVLEGFSPRAEVIIGCQRFAVNDPWTLLAV
jgi:hypothetical protein